MSRKVIVVGGGAGGSGAAARIRRQDEKACITIYERSSYASYSNCGLPYEFSDEVKEFEDLIVTTPEELKYQYNLDVKVKHEVIEINPNTKTIKAKNLLNNEIIEDNYDTLVIAAGASALRPNIPGLDKTNNVFSLKTPDDVKAVDEYKIKNQVNNVVVIGAGYIGAEIAENFVHDKKTVHLVDRADHFLPRNLDKDMAAFLTKSCNKNNLKTYLGKGAKEIHQDKVILQDGTEIKTDLTFLTIGVKVESEMLKNAGLELGTTAGIKVDKFQRTNIKDIYAAGDIAETIDYNGDISRITLAFPASRQGVVAANDICGYKDHLGNPDIYKGVTGACTLTMFDTTVASVGKTEEQLKKENIQYFKTINARMSKIGCVQGGKQVWLKVLFDKNYKILGAQSAGPKEAEKRISYISLAMQANIPFIEFENFMNAYSPTIDTHYDSTTMAARLARHQFDGTLRQAFVKDLKKHQEQGWILVDVREKEEWDQGVLEGATKIALSELRNKISEFDPNKKNILNSKTGARSYNASLVLATHGIKNTLNLAGGYLFAKNFFDSKLG